MNATKIFSRALVAVFALFLVAGIFKLDRLLDNNSVMKPSLSSDIHRDDDGTGPQRKDHRPAGGGGLDPEKLHSHVPLSCILIQRDPEDPFVS